jgi:hypothetical protein
VTLASEVEGVRLYGPDGSLAGTVVNLLFHPSGEPVVVGATVRPLNALVVVGRPETYVPLSALRFERGHTWLTIDKLPKTRTSAEALGYDPELTVIWSGMPTSGPSGKQFGTVGDFDFDPGTGAVLGLVAHEGAAANAAYGRLAVSAGAVLGYSNGAVRLSAEAAELEASGGLAKASAAAVAGASESVSAVGEIVGDAVVRASTAAGRAIKVVKESDVAGKAARKAGATWRDSVKAFKDGMKGDG